MTRPLHVLGHFHAYPPRHNAGAEWMTHAMLRYLHQVHGIDCKVILSRNPRRRDTFQHIPVETVLNPTRAGHFYQWADVVLTHLDVTRTAMRLARQHQRPLAHVVHNDRQLTYWQVGKGNCQLAIYNSRWIADSFASFDVPSAVVLPPVWVADYQLGAIHQPDQPTVAMLNISEPKGAPTFYAVAEAMPDYRFLGVKGSYGVQQLQALPNVELLRNQPDVRRIYRRASCVIMPSHYESYGRVVVEAAAAGRPSIAAPTPGLVETGVPWRLIDPEDTDGWVQALRELHQPATWLRAAYVAHTRALELEDVSRGQMDDLAAQLGTLQPPAAARVRKVGRAP